MEILPFILTVSSVHAIPSTICNRMKIGDRFYEKQVLWADIGRPYNLNVHKSTNTLFFSYSATDTYSDVDFQLAFFNLDSKEYQSIAGIRGGCTVAIDHANDDIYMGGSDGIYKFNMLTKIADFYKEKGQNIWSLFHRKNLFYISYPEQKLHMEIDGKFAAVQEFRDFEVDSFHVAVNGGIYFANKTGLFKYDSEYRQARVLNELITVRQIVEDSEENIYFVTNFGLYLDGKVEELKKIAGLKNVFGLAFDRENHFVMSDENSIVRLIPAFKGCENKVEHW